MTGQAVHIFSSGLWELRGEVAAMSGLEPQRCWLAAPRHGSIAGWGHKPTADRARAAAARHGLPYLAFEDGFLRSLKPGRQQRPASMVIDRSGIYYDASQPSDLETLLETAEFSAAECDAAKTITTEIVRRRLSKYNHGASAIDDIGLAEGKPLVLLIDQTWGDASVAGGLADADTFSRMAQAAVAENPGATIAAKLHPEVIAGGKRGYLADTARHLGLRLISADVSPWALIGLSPHVYTVSSQFGFEALLGGCRVTCFGMPFYAGWGLTADRMAVARRTRRRSIAELAAAVYLRYSRYFDVWRRTPVDALTAIGQLDFQRRHYLGNAQATVCYRISPWKRAAVTAMLDGPQGPPRFTRNLAQAIELAKANKGRVAAWGLAAQRIRETRGIECLAVEDGFLRSAGLGAAFVAPLSLVFDTRGIYYDPRRPSDIEHLLATAVITSGDRAQAEILRTRIISEKVTKYNLGGASEIPPLPPDRAIVLVPGQVADDAAVLSGAGFGGGRRNVNVVLLAEVRRGHPAAFVIFKPHPDVENLGRRGRLSAVQELRDADCVIRNISLEVLLPLVSHVETYSSLAGFEALLRGVPVTVHGLPFYAGWGLTRDLQESPRRGRQITLDDLLAVALMQYPRYWDPVSGLACPPDVVLDRLKSQRLQPDGPRKRLGRMAGRTVILCRRAAAYIERFRSPEAWDRT